MVTATNYTATAPSGTLNVSCGRFGGDVGILLIGDSNLVGSGAGTRQALVNTIYQWDNDTNLITALNGADPVFNHTLNFHSSGRGPEVGPDVPFCDKFATERGGGRRVVGLPCGDISSGFSSGQWFDTQEMYELMQEITNEFYAADSANTIGAVLIVLGANDVSQSDTVWQGHLDNMIDEIRSTAFTYNATQPNMNTVPIIVCGMAPDWYTGVTARQDIQTVIENTPTRKTYTGYASTASLASEAGDAIHLSGASNITLGETRAWTAFIAAEVNT